MLWAYPIINTEGELYHFQFRHRNSYDLCKCKTINSINSIQFIVPHKETYKLCMINITVHAIYHVDMQTKRVE